MIPLNHDDAHAGEQLRPRDEGSGNLALRTVSACVLAPVALACAYVGGWLFIVVCGVAAGGILWEWTRLVVNRIDARIVLPGLAAVLIALVLTVVDQLAAAVGVIAIGAVLTTGLMSAWPRQYPPSNPTLWAAAGVIYAGVAFFGPVLLRRDTEWGFVAVLFLAGTVWTTDIFAYFVGRAVGGPRLWPSLSPNKTWAGAIGGLAGGVVAGVAVAYASGLGKVAIIGVIALVLSVVAQAGDLFESAVKRRFGAKDAGWLIPGHGGLMDRLDGFLVAALAALIIGILRHGTDAPAEGLLVW